MHIAELGWCTWLWCRCVCVFVGCFSCGQGMVIKPLRAGASTRDVTWLSSCSAAAVSTTEAFTAEAISPCSSRSLASSSCSCLNAYQAVLDTGFVVVELPKRSGVRYTVANPVLQQKCHYSSTLWHVINTCMQFPASSSLRALLWMYCFFRRVPALGCLDSVLRACFRSGGTALILLSQHMRIS